MNVAFTTIFGDIDNLKDPLVKSEGWEYICYTDQPFKSDIWKIVPIKCYGNPYYFSRYLWHNPPIKADNYLRIGAQVVINCDLNELFKTYLTGYDIALMRHWFYKNIDEECRAVIKFNQAPAVKVREAYKMIIESGFPLGYGLYSMGFVLFNKSALPFFKELSDLCQNGTHREQIYFPYLWWKHPELKVNVIEERIEMSLFKWTKHEKNQV